MPAGSSSKRERQYEHIKESAQDRGESAGRAKEIAARTVNKERARSGESKTASRSSTQQTQWPAPRPAAGWAGIVVNGCVRDVASLRRQEDHATHQACSIVEPLEACVWKQSLASLRLCSLPCTFNERCWLPSVQHPNRPHGPGQPPHEARQGARRAERRARGGA